MERKTSGNAAKFLAGRRRRLRWQRVVTALASVVVFCTTYMLILPAITLTVDEAWMNQIVEPHVYINCPGAARYEASTFAGSSVPVDVLNGFDEQEVTVEAEETPLSDLPDDVAAEDSLTEEAAQADIGEPVFSWAQLTEQAASSARTWSSTPAASSTRTEAPAQALPPVQVISPAPEEPTAPAEPAAPEEPSAPVEPAAPEEPAEPVESEEPSEPMEPEESANPEEPIESEEPADPAESANPEDPSETNDADAPEEDGPEASEPAEDSTDGEQAGEDGTSEQPEEPQDPETDENPEISEDPEAGDPAQENGGAVEDIEDGDTPLADGEEAGEQPDADGEAEAEQPHEHTAACYDVAGNMICEEGKAELRSLFTQMSASSESGIDSTLQNELPHTGGVGLTTWYTAGGMLLLAAACLLYKKLREGSAA